MDALDVLTTLGLPEAMITSCRDILDEHAQAIHRGRPPTVGGAVFGGSESGQTLAHHTSVAHQHVVDALENMVAGLRGYAENLDGFAKDLRDRDQQAGVDLTPTRKRELDLSTGCAAGTDYTDQSNATCAAPTGSEG